MKLINAGRKTMLSAYIRAAGLKRNIKARLLADTRGMGTIEVIIIIAVLVALALIFRNFITQLAQKIFDKIQEKTDGAIDTL